MLETSDYTRLMEDLRLRLVWQRTRRSGEVRAGQCVGICRKAPAQSHAVRALRTQREEIRRSTWLLLSGRQPNTIARQPLSQDLRGNLPPNLEARLGVDPIVNATV